MGGRGAKPAVVESKGDLNQGKDRPDPVKKIWLTKNISDMPACLP